ncbi:hypothetical protein CAPTEDRAFT_212102 [Capitella teleta]|uniref:Uncharacterized protein n=1 Tax=Capitella teleta TaxID=283909 RepID=R7V1K4_CAPTE|nr:hypothetical protein CAPTEDRAFT_212102 [Capitella teleta]|eukprot:ELU12392.1 hypothetical protein CAPTEDRAFT_212102 [Capitella teleta]
MGLDLHRPAGGPTSLCIRLELTPNSGLSLYQEREIARLLLHKERRYSTFPELTDICWLHLTRDSNTHLGRAGQNLQYVTQNENICRKPLSSSIHLFKVAVAQMKALTPFLYIEDKETLFVIPWQLNEIKRDARIADRLSLFDGQLTNEIILRQHETIRRMS